MTRVTVRPASGPANSASQASRAIGMLRPVSTIVTPPVPDSDPGSPSSSSQRLMWLSEPGTGERVQPTPSASAIIAPASGTVRPSG